MIFLSKTLYTSLQIKYSINLNTIYGFLQQAYYSDIISIIIIIHMYLLNSRKTTVGKKIAGSIFDIYRKKKNNLKYLKIMYEKSFLCD